MDKISVIVPIYKVENYLDQCVETIVGQTYKNLEIILVNDGSPDNCPQKCDEWAKKDNRIIVVHKANGGLSDARNAGIAIATGDYIGFVDSDDYIAPDMYELLLMQAKENGSDVSICSMMSVNEDMQMMTPFRTIRDEGTFSGEDAFQKICSGEGTLAVMSRLYKRSLFETGLRFKKGILYEDVYFDVDLFLKSKISVTFISYAGYYYLQRSTSIMGESATKGLHTDAVMVRQYMYEELKRHDAGYCDAMIPYCVYFLLSELEYKQSTQFLKECCVFFEEILCDVLRCSTVGVKFKLKYIVSILKMKRLL